MGRCSKEEINSSDQKTIKYTVTISASVGGTVSPEGEKIFSKGTVISITATPDEGYRFLKWEGIEKSNPCGKGRQLNGALSNFCHLTTIINSNKEIQAVFQKAAQ